MSHGSLVFFDRDNQQTCIDYPNGHGMAAIFDVARKTAGSTQNWMFWAMGLGNNQEQVFANTRSLPEAHRNILLMAFWEPTLTARTHWPVLVGYILTAFGVQPSEDREADLQRLHARIEASDFVNHWGHIATELHQRQNDESLTAFGLYLTSVNDWPFSGPFNEETEEYGTFDPNSAWWFTPGPEPTRGPASP